MGLSLFVRQIGPLSASSRFSWVILYLGAACGANLLTAWLGPVASVFNAFVLIGLDLTTRDRLHDEWAGRGLVWRMGALIAAGSLLSWVVNRGAGRVALASLLAFAGGALVDAMVYHGLRRRAWLLRVNGSNVFSALVDSLIFPTVAFGGLNLVISALQLAAKVAGGFAWSMVLRRLK